MSQTPCTCKISLSYLFRTSDGLKFWSKPATGIQWKGWAPPKDQSKAVDIETTAYALLNLGVNKDLEGGLPVLKWITSQRNPEGGFSSTQVLSLLDTCMFVLYSFLLSHNFKILKISKSCIFVSFIASS